MNKHRFCAITLAVLLACNLSGCVVLGAAAVGGTAAVATDRRSTGAYVDDKSLELYTSSQISKSIPAAHVNTNSYNRWVLLTGEVPNHVAQEKVEAIARSQQNVRNVFNYTEVSFASSMNVRSNDTWITTKVRSNLLATKGLPSNQIEVTTEHSVVYLMGLLTKKEAALAAKIASETAGVQQVITLFEPYIDN